jgi:hypothetical protein
MKHSAEYEEFTRIVDRVLSVPHDVLKKRIDAERKRSAAKTVRPGPKPKRKTITPSASGHEANGH